MAHYEQGQIVQHEHGCTANITSRHYCANHCHKDHRLINRGLSNAFCDCSIIHKGRHYCKGMARVICHSEDQTTNNKRNDNDNGLFDDEDLNEDEREWAPVNDILFPGYRASSMVKHLERLNLCQIDSLILTCVKYHNYTIL